MSALSRRSLLQWIGFVAAAAGEAFRGPALNGSPLSLIPTDAQALVNYRRSLELGINARLFQNGDLTYNGIIIREMGSGRAVNTLDELAGLDDETFPFPTEHTWENEYDA